MRKMQNNLNSASEWVAFQPGQDMAEANDMYYVTGAAIIPVEDGNGLELCGRPLTNGDSTTNTNVIRCFPQLPMTAKYGSALFNSDGTRLAISTTTSQLYLVSLTRSSAQERFDLLKIKSEGNLVAFEWSESELNSPCRQARIWGLTGEMIGNSFLGKFTGLHGSFDLKQRDRNIWQGSCTFAHEHNFTWPMRLQIHEDGEHASVGLAMVEAVDPNYFGEGDAVDFCWHPSSSNYLCVLDKYATLRLYNVLKSADRPEVVIDLKKWLQDDKTVVKIRFFEGGSTRGNVWERLSCFALCTDGSILCISPLGKPQSLQLPISLLEEEKQDLEEMLKDSRARQDNILDLEEALKFVNGLLGDNAIPEEGWGEPAVRVISNAPKSPDVRYQTGKQSNATAFDLVASRIGEKATVFHRTWTCGLMDIVLWPETKIRPAWASRSSTALVVLDQQPTSTPQKGAKVKERLKQFARARRPDQPSSVEGPDGPRIIKCVELGEGQNIRPFVYSCENFPLFYFVLDSGSGLAYLFEAAWAKPNSDRDQVSVNFASLGHVHSSSTKFSVALYSGVSLGSGVLVNKGRAGVEKFDFFQYFRRWDAQTRLKLFMQSIRNESLEKEFTKELETIQQNLDEEVNLLEKVRGTLQSYGLAIPDDFRGIQVDNIKGIDGDRVLEAMRWMVNVHKNLIADGTTAERSVLSVLTEFQVSLSASLEAQKTKLKNQQDELSTILNLLPELRTDQEGLKAAVLVAYEHIEALRESAEKTKNLAVRALNTPSNAPSSNRHSREVNRLRELHNRLNALKNTVMELRSAVQKPERPSSGSESDDGYSLVGTSLVPTDYLSPRLSEQVTDHLLTLRTIVERASRKLAAAKKVSQSAKSQVQVVIVAFEKTAEQLDEYEDVWRDLALRREPFKIFVQKRLLQLEAQAEVRESLEEEFEQHGPINIPHHVQINGRRVRVIILPISVTVKIREEDGRFYLYREGPDEAVLPLFPSQTASEFQEVDPVSLHARSFKDLRAQFFAHVLRDQGAFLEFVEDLNGR